MPRRVFGLIKAIKKFNPDTGYKFSTYATWWIRQTISRIVYDKALLIKEPAYLYAKINKVDRVAHQIEAGGREATPELVAEVMGISVQKVLEYQHLHFQRNVESLNKPLDSEDSENTLEDTIAAPESSTKQSFSFSEEQLEQLFAPFTKREALAVALLYGLDGSPQRTLLKVGRLMGISRERVRQLVASGTPKMLVPAQQMGLKIYLE